MLHQPQPQATPSCAFRPFRVRARLHIVLLHLPLLARTLDDVREIADGDVEGEVEGCEHDGEEKPPADHRGDECEGSAGLETT